MSRGKKLIGASKDDSGRGEEAPHASFIPPPCLEVNENSQR